MGKLGVFSGREVCAVLVRHGFVQVRQRGSHVVMQRQILGQTTSVPVPLHDEIRIGTLQSIIRQSGIDRSEFEV